MVEVLWKPFSVYEELEIKQIGEKTFIVRGEGKTIFPSSFFFEKEWGFRRKFYKKFGLSEIILTFVAVFLGTPTYLLNRFSNRNLDQDE